jgi:Cdc6-like AAA superfamily ATPase
LSPNEVRKALRLITALKECVIFIDEFERLRDQEAAGLFSDTLKMLSDQQVPATVIIVGVADNLQELLRESRSIERALRQVHMPRMSPDELREIVHRGLGLIQMTIENEALDLITSISQGLPHFTHLIAQSATRVAINDGDKEISRRHVDAALAILDDKAYETIIEDYDTAVFSHRETLYPLVLLAAAMAETDEQGFFAAADLVSPLSRVARKPYDIPAFSRHLHALAEDNRGPTLQRKGSEHRYRFRFVNPLLQPYVLMKGLTEKVISAEDLTGRLEQP